ncbi:hypothetical protein QFZ34_000421 [Phyllobacterium ifriqiyense]|uniref:Uncharacterized protein n=1 Tax=Phyllobacterium ifriqiyense TaxID=314238 RepID=A0ABU0S3F2_9HYPH|nr:hypothetical protein [Phyllobacterium ifriqiyense]MDQ0995244.1 hypothetical protein [Phyllobacterium ifriqiyense]
MSGVSGLIVVPVRITVIFRAVLPSKTDDVKVCWVRIFDVEKTLI